MSHWKSLKKKKSEIIVRFINSLTCVHIYFKIWWISCGLLRVRGVNLLPCYFFLEFWMYSTMEKIQAVPPTWDTCSPMSPKEVLQHKQRCRIDSVSHFIVYEQHPNDANGHSKSLYCIWMNDPPFFFSPIMYIIIELCLVDID